MSKFIYSYQKILEMKENIREGVESNYARLINIFNLEEDILLDLHDKQNKLKKQLSNVQEKGVLISDINLSLEYLKHLDSEILKQSKKVEEIKQEIELKFNELVEVKIEEKKWLNLKEKEYSEYVFESNKIEQTEIDEIASRCVMR